MKKTLTFKQGKDLHDFKIPSLTLLADGQETELVLIPFRAYAMQISNPSDTSYCHAMEYTSDNMEYLYKKGERHFRDELSKAIKEVVEAFTSNNYGKDYECSLRYLHSDRFWEIENEFIKRVKNWVELRIQGVY
jgi:hypothetical protein